uniref:Uncharacterized protein n=1 Tax=Heterorhabditis bacteriophora TaxID=37862 RepID=A0A1I7WJM7_HETBA
MPLRKTFEFVSQEDLVKLVRNFHSTKSDCCIVRFIYCFNLAYKIFLDIFYLLHIIVLALGLRFLLKFPKINYKQVEKSLLPYIEGKMSTTGDLESIVFVKLSGDRSILLPLLTAPIGFIYDSPWNVMKRYTHRLRGVPSYTSLHTISPSSDLYQKEE